MSLDTNLQSAFNAIGLQVKQKVSKSDIGIANGIASLGADGKVPTSQLPSFVDDVLEFVNLAGFPATGEAGKIYIALDTNKTYRWSGSTYIYITSGAVDSVAGKTGAVTLTKSDVGLNNIDNTSDINKPISTATQIALNLKVDKVAGKQLSTEDYTTAEKTKLSGLSNYTLPIASTTVLGGVKAGANVTINANGVISSSGAVTSVAGKTGAVTLTKSDVGLNNIDNTSDATKNVLSATKLTTARTINGVLFDGTSDIEVGSISPFWENDVTINESYTIGTNKNAMVVGPITVANNVDIIVPNGSSLKII